MAALFLSFSVIALHVETILQIYVTVSSENQPIASSTVAMSSLATTAIAFISSSVMSAALALLSAKFSWKNLASFTFTLAHVLSFGLMWRIFKSVLYFSEGDYKDITTIRLIHVVFQSAPYIVIYSIVFLLRGTINHIQVISLLASLTSLALAITSYNLQQKLNYEEVSNKSHVTGAEGVKSHVAVAITLFGTFLVIASRLLSMSLMAVEERWWVFLPVGIHCALMLTVFALFRSRKSKQRSVICCATESVITVGMSLLNTIELVYDNIDQVVCKYVLFYSLFLVENIVMLSFWLLGSELQYVVKLISVVGTLAGCIVGLIAKFVGCSMLQRSSFRSSQRADINVAGSSSPFSASRSTIDTTVATTATIDNVARHYCGDEDDIISIIQASVIARSNFSARDDTNWNIQASTMTKSTWDIEKRFSKTDSLPSRANRNPSLHSQGTRSTILCPSESNSQESSCESLKKENRKCFDQGNTCKSPSDKDGKDAFEHNCQAVLELNPADLLLALRADMMYDVADSAKAIKLSDCNRSTISSTRKNLHLKPGPQADVRNSDVYSCSHSDSSAEGIQISRQQHQRITHFGASRSASRNFDYMSKQRPYLRSSNTTSCANISHTAIPPEEDLGETVKETTYNMDLTSSASSTLLTEPTFILSTTSPAMEKHSAKRQQRRRYPQLYQKRQQQQLQQMQQQLQQKRQEQQRHEYYQRSECYHQYGNDDQCFKAGLRPPVHTDRRKSEPIPACSQFEKSTAVEFASAQGSLAASDDYSRQAGSSFQTTTPTMEMTSYDGETVTYSSSLSASSTLTSACDEWCGIVAESGPRKPEVVLPADSSRVSSEENILHWLRTVEALEFSSSGEDKSLPS